MSLLLDARKKIELALRHSDAHKSSATQSAGGLSIEDLSANIPQKKPDESFHATQRAANLFAAKAAYTGGMRLGIIPIALISGLVLAAGGGYYVWREISPPVMQRHNPAPAPRPPEGRVSGGVPFTGAAPATPIANATPPAAPVTQTVPAPATSAAPTTSAAPAKSISVENKPAPAGAGMKQIDHAPKIAAPFTPPAAPHNTAARPIRIEHGQEGDAVDQTLLAAWQAYRNGDLGTAWQRYNEVLLKDARNRDALLGMAAIAQQQSQDAIAARYYDQVLIIDPRDPIANAGMSALLGTNDEANTESRLKLLLVQHPQSAALHFALGNLYAEQSRWGDAQQAYFNAYNLEQSNAQFAFNLAVSLDHLGQNKLAAQHYQRALQMDVSDNPGFNRAQTQQRINELTAP